ncbi:MAG: SGNH/GDSL hydrolase family protein [Nanoarchaeota archaeon]|nr:SGNH/GDSL hydrolase family protein [Nanoarchaeota archaeon]
MSIMFAFIITEILLNWTEKNHFLNYSNIIYTQDNFLRELYFEGYEFSKDLGWISTQVQSELKENNQKTNNPNIILFIGDSVTEGACVEESYSVKLSKQMNNEKQNYKIINLGVSGYNSFQEKILLEKTDFKTSIIVLGFFSNDYINTPIFIKKDDEIIGINNLFYEYKFKNVISKIILSSKFFKLAYQILIQKNPCFENPENIICLNHNKNKIIKEIKEIKNLSDKKNSELIIIHIPTPVLTKNNMTFYYENNKFNSALLKNITNQLGIHFIDMIHEFQKNDVLSGKINCEPIDNHPNELGHELIAKKLYKYITERNLI